MAQTPDNRQFSALKSLVARYVGMEDMTDAETEAGDAINLSIDALNTRTWRWNLISQDITLTGGTATYTLNSTFKKPRSALFLNSSSETTNRLNWMEPKSADVFFQDRSTSGQPRVYTAYNDYNDSLVTLVPTPSTAFVSANPTLRIQYYRWVQALANPTDELAAPRSVEYWLIWNSRAEMAANHDASKAGLAEVKQEKAWRNLIRDEVLTTDWWRRQDA